MLCRFISVIGMFSRDNEHMITIAGALFLAAISGSLGTFIAGCMMACRKSCCCKSSITRLAMVQFIGGGCLYAGGVWMDDLRCCAMP